MRTTRSRARTLAAVTSLTAGVIVWAAAPDAWFVALVVIVGGLLLFRRPRHRTAAEQTPEVGVERSAAGERTLTVFELWGSAWLNVEVVGEAYRRDAFQRLYRHHGIKPGDEIMLEAALVPEQGNRHDPNAVRVDVDVERDGGETVGYLSREDAARYRPVLDRLLAGGYCGVTTARIWASNSDGTWRARVTLSLADPREITPANEQPTGDLVTLPSAGRTIQVTGEEQHLEVLKPFVGSGRTGVWVTLHAITHKTPRSEKRLVEVRVDGKRCGALSPATSADLLPVVERIEDLGRLAVARGYVSGNSLKAELVVSAPKAAELTERWIDENLT